MSTLSFKNINKIYDNNVQAVFDFNLEVNDKDFIVFVGPSGCGKSTTLRMIAGLEDISSGELYIDGELVNNVVPKDRDIAMVFQSYALYPQMTVFQNMEFALRLRKIKMPLLIDSKDTLPLKEKNKALLKEIRKVDHKFKKQQNNNDLLAKHISLFEQLSTNMEEIRKLQMPVKGIDYRTIKANNKEIKSLSKDLKNIEGVEQKAFALVKKVSFNLEEEQECQQEYDAILDLLKNSKDLKSIQIAKLVEENKYLLANEVQLKKLRHLTSLEIAVEINKTANALDLTRYLFRKPKALSGGQRQRVALGRAIVRKPKVFLMDEPLSNLDAKLRAAMRSEISKIHERVGGTTIYVTHDQVEAMTMATRIVIMKDGRIQQIGTPDEVYTDPANKFVAGFIGSPSTNFIKAKVNKDNLVIGEGDDTSIVKLNDEQKAKLNTRIGKDVLIGIRPEYVEVNHCKNYKNATETKNLECDFAELLGSELLLHFYYCGTKIIVKADSSLAIKTKDMVDVSLNVDKMCFFDAETEMRIK